jgi:putative peptide zinc metalloprotease protein
MAVDRPTFSESWYRVADLHPRLRATVQVHRQHFRGQMWQVLQDPTSNQFFRVNDSAYTFIALLDGRRTVADVWETCNAELGDNAPTQGEVIQLLGQLYTSNLLQGELPPDAEGLLGRFQKRRMREVRGKVMNLMFIHIPLFDPDAFLNRWVKLFGKLFSWPGFVGWLMLIGVGISAVIGRAGELTDPARNVLDPANLPFLYIGILLTKVVHEFGHAFACKRFGRLDGGGGEVHVMGVMLLVLTPLPYVDASSCWAFRSKWRRVLVSSAGMLSELALASVAAIIWSKTSPGTTIHVICFNMMFVASISTLLFNANPLLRYDGYYILSDIIEIPNLSNRSRQYLYYLVRKYAWGVRRVTNPAHSAGEKAWFVFYGIASTIYRVFICVAILLRVADKLFIVGAILAIGAFISWVITPLFKFIHYLATSGELARTRGRAVGSTLLTLAAIVVLLGQVKFPDRVRVQGIVSVPAGSQAELWTDVGGQVVSAVPSGTWVTPDGEPVMVLANPELEARYQALLCERVRLEVERRLLRERQPAMAAPARRAIDALDRDIETVTEQLAALRVQAPREGVWLSPEYSRSSGQYASPSQPLGTVLDGRTMIIRAAVDQPDAILIEQALREPGAVAIRVVSRPDLELTGTIHSVAPTAREELFSPALSFAAGGSVATDPTDQTGRMADQRIFEVVVIPDATDVPLRIDQRVVLRFEMPPKPLAQQWWRRVLQLVQQRFHL